MIPSNITDLSFGGMDGSHYQPDKGPMDLARTKAISTDNWIAWKCSQGTTYVDPTFNSVRQTVKNLKFNFRMFYHWLSHDRDPAQQAQWYLKNIHKFDVGEGAMNDAEEDGITVESCLALMEPIEEVRQGPMACYTGLYVAGGSIWRSPLIRESKFGPRPMHLAAYVSLNSLLTRVNSLGVAHLPMAAWQWGSSGIPGQTFETTGITGNFDVNDIYDFHLYELACGLTAVVIKPPTPTGADDMPQYVTNKETRLNEFDNQNWSPRTFVFVIEAGGKLRHINGNDPEAALTPDPKADLLIPEFSNFDLDRWPKYVEYVPGGGIGKLNVDLGLDLNGGKATGTATPV